MGGEAQQRNLKQIGSLSTVYLHSTWAAKGFSSNIVVSPCAQDWHHMTPNCSLTGVQFEVLLAAHLTEEHQSLTLLKTVYASVHMLILIKFVTLLHMSCCLVPYHNVNCLLVPVPDPAKNAGYRMMC